MRCSPYFARNIIDRAEAEQGIEALNTDANVLRSILGLNLIGNDIAIESEVWLPRMSVEQAFSVIGRYADAYGTFTPAPVVKEWPPPGAERRRPSGAFPGLLSSSPGMRRLLLISLLYVALSCFPWALAQTVTIFAASSLGDAFSELADRFEAQSPGRRLVLNFAGSSTLATQLLQGARADVFASADEVQMQRLVAENLVADAPRAFASNHLTILVPVDSELTDASELATPGLLLVLAGPEVPAGRYARQLLELLDRRWGEGFAAAVLANVVSNEPNVRQAAAKVALGEADAAIVYRTDARGLERVRTVTPPDAEAIAIRYPIARLTEAPQPELAAAFLAFVQSPGGLAVLARHGFAAP